MSRRGRSAPDAKLPQSVAPPQSAGSQRTFLSPVLTVSGGHRREVGLADPSFEGRSSRFAYGMTQTGQRPGGAIMCPSKEVDVATTHLTSELEAQGVHY